MWPFTPKVGLSKFHAMAIFTVVAVKLLKILGMWVRFPFHVVKKVTATLKNFTPWKRSQSPWKYFTPGKNVVMSEKYFTPWNKVNFLRKRQSVTLNIMPSLCHVVCKSFTASVIESLSESPMISESPTWGWVRSLFCSLLCFILWFWENKRNEITEETIRRY